MQLGAAQVAARRPGCAFHWAEMRLVPQIQQRRRQRLLWGVGAVGPRAWRAGRLAGGQAALALGLPELHLDSDQGDAHASQHHGAHAQAHLQGR